MADMMDGRFTGITGPTKSEEGDSSSTTQGWTQMPNDYTQYKGGK